MLYPTLLYRKTHPLAEGESRWARRAMSTIVVVMAVAAALAVVGSVYSIAISASTMVPFSQR